MSDREHQDATTKPIGLLLKKDPLLATVQDELSQLLEGDDGIRIVCSLDGLIHLSLLLLLLGPSASHRVML